MSDSFTSTRTIDNLGPQVSIDFAQAQAAYDPKLVSDGALARQAEISVLTGGYASHYDALFGMSQTNKPSGVYNPPPGYTEKGLGNLYSNEIIPGISGKEWALPEQHQSPSLIDFLTKLDTLDRTFHMIAAEMNRVRKA